MSVRTVSCRLGAIVPVSHCNPSDRPPEPRSLSTIQLSKSAPDLELSVLSQLVHTSQTRLIAQALYVWCKTPGILNLKEMVDKIIEEWEERTLNGDVTEEGWRAALRAIDPRNGN